MRNLALLALIFLSACAHVNGPNPAYPSPDEKVAQDLEKLSETDYPYLWEWLSRLQVYEDKLGVR